MSPAMPWRLYEAMNIRAHAAYLQRNAEIEAMPDEGWQRGECPRIGMHRCDHLEHREQQRAWDRARKRRRKASGCTQTAREGR